MASERSERWSAVTDADLLGTPFGTTDAGRADFRSVPLGRLRKLSGATFRDCDFTAADFSELRLYQCQFINCVFDRADFTNLCEYSCRFDRCSFVRTDWRVGAVGFRDHGQPKSQYVGCTFEKVRFAQTNFQDARFEATRFIGPLKGVDFNVCGFWSCCFTGLLDDVMFRGNYLYDSDRERNPPATETGLHDTSFADAELHWIGLAGGCVAEHVEMPHSGDAFLCDLARLLREEAALLDGIVFEMQRALKKYIDVIRPGPAREGLASQPLVIVSRYDLVSLSNEATGGDAYERLRARTAAADAALVH